MNYDKIIIGAGLYGLYSALYCAKKNQRILVLEWEDEAFSRATYINQARVHMGYHYPRSFSTAIKSRNYFDRFVDDYGFCINKDFKKIYAISKDFSWTNAEQFKKFCDNSNIKCEIMDKSIYFKDNMCDESFITEEYTFDAQILKSYFLKEIAKYKNVTIIYNARITRIYEKDKKYYVESNNNIYFSSFLLNATYGSINQIISMVGFKPFDIKYELCEMIICEVNDKLKNVGITVMDGPFFSLMPFGKTSYHSLTSVTFTPHSTSYGQLPEFSCQKRSKGYCSKEQLGNCNKCKYHPKTAWKQMSNLARKYLKDDMDFKYVKSYYSIKSILNASEIDDSRPTVVKVFSENPTFVSVLSGKINTVYDLEGVLDNEKA